MKSPASRVILPTTAIRAIESRHSEAAPPLMSRAGVAAARLALELARPDGPILVLVGPGNNGGDGLVLATEIKRSGRDVVVAFAGDASKLPRDAAQALNGWQVTGGELVAEFVPGNWALAVDALLGIGLARPVSGRIADWIERFNRMPCRRLSLDVPSGLDADTGKKLGPTAHATDTISFIAIKPGLLTLDGPDCAGALHLADLDLSFAPPDDAGHVIAPDDFLSFAGGRTKNSHKGHFGDVGILGGNAGMVGAAWIAGRAALELGGGRVFVGCIAKDAPGLDPLTPELMMRPASDVHTLASALAIGPGLGQDEAANIHVRRALAFAGPLVLDADALNLIGANPGLQTAIAERSSPTIMTPHPTEAGRLLQCSTADIQADRVAAAKALAERYRVHVVLKGCGSIVAHPDSSWAINGTGNPGMAAAGMGDALTGFVASLLAQHWPARYALEAAVHLHGAAGDALVAAGIGPIGMTVSELIHAARSIRNGWSRPDSAKGLAT